MSDNRGSGVTARDELNGCCFSLIEQIVSCWHRLIFHRNLQPTTNLPSPPPASLLALPLPFPFLLYLPPWRRGRGGLGLSIHLPSSHCSINTLLLLHQLLLPTRYLCNYGARCLLVRPLQSMMCDVPRRTNHDLLVAARSRQPPSVASTIISFLTTT